MSWWTMALLDASLGWSPSIGIDPFFNFYYSKYHTHPQCCLPTFVSSVDLGWYQYNPILTALATWTLSACYDDCTLYFKRNHGASHQFWEMMLFPSLEPVTLIQHTLEKAPSTNQLLTLYLTSLLNLVQPLVLMYTLDIHQVLKLMEVCLHFYLGKFFNMETTICFICLFSLQIAIGISALHPSILLWLIAIHPWWLFLHSHFGNVHIQHSSWWFDSSWQHHQWMLCLQSVHHHSDNTPHKYYAGHKIFEAFLGIKGFLMCYCCDEVDVLQSLAMIHTYSWCSASIPC